eukprot:Gb_30410 [translate_table: standard]
MRSRVRKSLPCPMVMSFPDQSTVKGDQGRGIQLPYPSLFYAWTWINCCNMSLGNMQVIKWLVLTFIPIVLWWIGEHARLEMCTVASRRSYCVDLELPLYKFGRTVFANPCRLKVLSSCHTQEDQNGLDMLLLALWEDRANQGLLRYDVTACETKIIPGSYGFVAQLNERWHLKRRAVEFQANRVLQPFDSSKFNFTKVREDELLFCIRRSEDESPELIPKTAVCNDANLIIMNVSPIEYGHVLLVPHAYYCLPQMVDACSLQLAIQMAATMNNCFFRIGYNSLGAFATVNHLHFQAYYLANPLPVELARTLQIAGNWKKCGLKIFEIVDYPVRGLLFEVGKSLEEMAEVVANCCCLLQNENMPFNILISECGARVFLLPQCFADKLAHGLIEDDIRQTKVNPAVWEISGHIVFKQKGDYDRATHKFVWDLLAAASLNQEDFEMVKRLCTGMAEKNCCQY